MESVLSFIYNNTLPASPTSNMLYKMMMSADYLGADLCVKACAIAFSKAKLDKDSVSHITDTLRRCPACNPAITEGVQSAYSGHLTKIYRDVPSIINNNAEQLSFCKLPLDAVEGWGRSDDLCVDSENSMVVLLNQWWHSQAEHMQTEECKKKLSNLIRIARLSLNYLQHALDKVDWFVPPFPEYKPAATLVNMTPMHHLVTCDQLIKTLALNNRTNISGTSSFSLQWRLSVESNRGSREPQDRSHR